MLLLLSASAASPGNGHGLIRKYELNMCRQCFRDKAGDIGFLKVRLCVVWELAFWLVAFGICGLSSLCRFALEWRGRQGGIESRPSCWPLGIIVLLRESTKHIRATGMNKLPPMTNHSRNRTDPHHTVQLSQLKSRPLERAPPRCNTVGWWRRLLLLSVDCVRGMEPPARSHEARAAGALGWEEGGGRREEEKRRRRQ
jgi:hypothetical protein